MKRDGYGFGEAAAPPLPPHNIEIEQGILGCLLAYPDAWSHANGLLPEHFFEGLHARVFEAIMDLAKAGKTVSPMILKARFEQDATLAEIGGTQYLSKLLGAATTPKSIKHYADHIRELASRRTVICACRETEAKAATVASVDGSDFRTALADHIGELTNLYVGSSERKTTFTAGEAAADAVARMKRLQAGETDPTAIPTGIGALDAKLGGLRRGEYTLLAGRPSMGKSALALQIAANVAEQGLGVAYFSLEMPAALLTPRLLSSKLWAPGVASPSYAAMLRGAVKEDDLRWAESVAMELKGWALTIDDEPGLTGPEIEARARVMASRFKSSGKTLGLVVVDHLHKMHAPGHSSKAAEFSEVSATLAEAAKRLDVPLLALAQLNRSVESREDKRPELSDLRESGGLEQDADVVLLCFREAYYLERQHCRNAGADAARLADLHAKAHDLEVICAKQRSGPIGSIRLWADMAVNVIRDMSEAA